MAVAKNGQVKADGAQGISIPELKISQLLIELIGVTPLIAHRFGESAIDKIAVGQSDAATVKKEPRNPAQDFQEARYLDDQGRDCFVSSGLKRAIISAGQRFAGEKGTELMGSFSISQELIPLEAPEPRMRTDTVVLAGISRKADLRYRPEYWPWTMHVPFSLNEGFLSLPQFLNLLRLAGFSVGIGDWRVEKKGDKGQFSIGQVVKL